MREKSAAFTLVELIAVILIVAILAKLIVSRSPSTQINLNAQAQQLASDIRYAQTMAMSRGVRYRLNLLSSTTYSISDINSNVSNNEITNAASTTLGTSITMTLPPTNLPNNLIAFDTQGAPYTNSTATTALATAAVITLTSGTKTTTVTIQPQTGSVTVP